MIRLGLMLGLYLKPIESSSVPPGFVWSTDFSDPYNSMYVAIISYI